jgi:glucuronoarabinoxylan endo-1,4-beta-xylanase
MKNQKSKSKKLILLLLCSFFCLTRSYGQLSTIYLDSTLQTIEGFGAANILPWRPDMDTAEVQTAFGTGPGQLGFSLLRLRLSSSTSEFPLSVPMARLASSMGANIFATPWSPPAAMKTNNNIVGGQLSDTSYASFAAYLNSYLTYMGNNGVPIYAISVQNEPDANVTYESCYWDATQFMNFLKYNGAAVGTRIIMPESESFNHAYSDSTLNDSTACSYVSIIGGHLYGATPGPYPLATSKGKELWMTEYLSTDTSWAGDLATGKQMSDCMSSGMNAYVTWYIIRYYGPINESGVVMKRGYVMSQFSKFIRPGYVQVYNTTSVRNQVSVTAYTNGTQIVIVAVNMNTAAETQTFAFQSSIGVNTIFTPYTTSQTVNVSQGTGIATSGGSFSALLPASSITTFVANSITAVKDHAQLPFSPSLEQNYPNPFNPATMISYQLTANSFVTIKVYDELGREVAKLVNEEESPGEHSVRWDAGSFSSGVYFYELTAGNFHDVKKMLLMK